MGKRKLDNTVEVHPSEIKNMAEKTLRKYPHLITITPIHLDEELKIIYTFDDLKGNLKHVITYIPVNSPKIDSITDVTPAALVYEMETKDLFGIKFQNSYTSSKLILPDCYSDNLPAPLLKTTKLKSLREKLSNHCIQNGIIDVSTDAIKYEGESIVTVPFGPYHPALKEPEHFAIVLKGEKVVDVFPRIGYAHRGVEKLCETRPFHDVLYLVERVCGICSFAHSWAYTLAVEELTGIKAPRRAEYLRTIVAELERIHSHVMWIGLLGYWAGFETMFMWIWGIREKIMHLLELITGNRVNASFITIGGTVTDVSEEKLNEVKKVVKTFEDFAEELMDALFSYDPLVERMKKIGVYDSKKAIKYGATGPVIRATGVPNDMRKIEPYGAYEELPWDVVTKDGGDVFNVTTLRMYEVLESSRIIIEAIENIPSGNPTPKRFFSRRIKDGEAIGRVEAPRGELFDYVMAKNSKNPYRVRIRTPTFANLIFTSNLLKGSTLSDVPLILTTMDPCFACLDRSLELKKLFEKSEVATYIKQAWRNMHGL